MSRTIQKSLMPAALVAALSIAAASPLAAQQPKAKYARDLPAKLRARATVTEDSAAKIAQARLPEARIQAVELENEHGRLIYSYELKIPGHRGIEEVNVDARTGAVVNVEHERG